MHLLRTKRFLNPVAMMTLEAGLFRLITPTRDCIAHRVEYFDGPAPHHRRILRDRTNLARYEAILFTITACLHQGRELTVTN